MPTLALTHAEVTDERIVKAEVHHYLGKLARARGLTAEAAERFDIADVIFRDPAVAPG